MGASSAGKLSTGAKEDESSIWQVWAAGFNHITAHSLGARFKLKNHLVL
jgi:hypothetical protein